MFNLEVVEIGTVLSINHRQICFSEATLDRPFSISSLIILLARCRFVKRRRWIVVGCDVIVSLCYRGMSHQIHRPNISVSLIIS